MMFGLKYFRIELLQVILSCLVKRLPCVRLSVAATLNHLIWPLGGGGGGQISLVCRQIPKFLGHVSQ